MSNEAVFPRHPRTRLEAKFAKAIARGEAVVN